jgi:hypothetical protein
MPQSPQVADTASDEPFLTGYDMDHLVTYLRLLDADAEGADPGIWLDIVVQAVIIGLLLGLVAMWLSTWRSNRN